VLRVSAVILVVALLLLAALWLGQRRLIYLPDSSAVPPAGRVLPGGEDVTLTTADGIRLTAWLVAPPPAVDRRVAVLYAPGNGGNRLGRASLARTLVARGLTVLLLDYRGYGGNPGHPTEEGLGHDARAARALLTARGWPAGRVLYLGESLGCAVVARLAVETPPAGLLLRSPFTDLAAAGQHNYPYLPVRPLLWDRLPVADLVGRITVPVTVVYGTADTVIPPEQSLAVARRAAGPTRLVAVPGADHNDAALFDGPHLVDAALALADSVPPSD
jgi:pimeloyl-ACP methyl ester carboxylesterase